LDYRGFGFWQVAADFSSQKRVERPWSPTSPLFKGYRGFFPWC
jgi:hypothetical protein